MLGLTGLYFLYNVHCTGAIQVINVLQNVKLFHSMRQRIIKNSLNCLSCNYSYADIDTHLSNHTQCSLFLSSQDRYQLLFTVVVCFLQSFDTYIWQFQLRYDLCVATDQMLYYLLLLLFVEDLLHLEMRRFCRHNF